MAEFHLLVRQRFADHDTWRTAFDSLDERRASAGMRTVLVSTNVDSPDEAVVLFACADVEATRAHFQSDALKGAHERAGVIEGSTQVTFLRS
ncbi:hypothetical protein [Nonomuraea sp. NPDC003214]